MMTRIKLICQIYPSWQFETLKSKFETFGITRCFISQKWQQYASKKETRIWLWLCFDILSDPKSSVWTYIGPIYHFIWSKKRKEKMFSLHQFKRRRRWKRQKGQKEGRKGEKGSWWRQPQIDPSVWVQAVAASLQLFTLKFSRDFTRRRYFGQKFDPKLGKSGSKCYRFWK